MTDASRPLPLVAGCGQSMPLRWSALGFVQVRSPPADGFYLELRSDGLTLERAQTREHGLCVDLRGAAQRRRTAGARHSPLARALGLRRHPRPTLLDATCGLGRDSAVLAALGCQVHATERHPTLYALVDDARERARAASDAPAWLANWPGHAHADARDWLAGPDRPLVDVVYIDPMFDAPRRRASPQKALAWMAELVGPDHDAGAVLAAARAHARRLTVVKQHARSAPIAAPDRQVSGRAVRFDIYRANPATP